MLGGADSQVHCNDSRHRARDGPRRLIVNADDFGLTDGVSEAIVRAWRDGIVTSTSAMISIDGAPERIARVHREHPGLPIGLHLTITCGRPVLPAERVPSLVGPGGRFRGAREILPHLPSIPLTELRAEAHAQAELLVTAGVRFDHIDSHQNILALYTPFFDVVRELAKEYGVPVRQPVPGSVAGDGIRLAGRGGGRAAVAELARFALRHPTLALRMMPHMGPAAFRKQAELLRQEGIAAPDWFLDRYYGNATVDNLVALVGQLPPGVSEVMVHPGVVNDDLRRWGGDYVEQRAAEFEVLVAPRIRKALAKAGVQLADFGAAG